MDAKTGDGPQTRQGREPGSVPDEGRYGSSFDGEAGYGDLGVRLEGELAFVVEDLHLRRVADDHRERRPAGDLGFRAAQIEAREQHLALRVADLDPGFSLE